MTLTFLKTASAFSALSKNLYSKSQTFASHASISSHSVEVGRVGRGGRVAKCKSKPTRIHTSATSNFMNIRQLISASKSTSILSSSFSTAPNNQELNRSPYAVLKLKTSATKTEIKNSFRKLAKEYHPDLNPQIPSQLSQTKMSELIHAYDQLMDDDFLGRVGDGRVALACEMFTLQELKMDRFHDVYSIRIRYYEDEENSGNNDDDENKDYNEKDVERQNKADSAFTVNDSNSTISDISTFNLIEHKAHPDDSISDIKRQLQSLYQTDWGLEGRRLDRDKLATGWEIVCISTDNDTDTDNRLSNDVPDSTEVMSYHLFLHSYNISDGDIVHAVVRRYIDEES